MRQKTSSRLQSKRKLPRWLKFFRYWYIRLLRLQGHPQEIARGLTVGVFSGFFPILGLQMIFAVILAVIFRGNKLAAAAATWISNPFTSVPIYAFNYTIGELLLGWDESPVDQHNFQINLQSWSSFIELGTSSLIKLFVGCFTVGLIAACFTYFFSLRFIKNWRDSRQFRRGKFN